MNTSVFLCSDESIYSWNTGDMEILMLASIINQPIHILTYNIQGLPAGTPPNERARMRTWKPMPDLVESNIFTMDEDVFLIYEDTVHFSLLVKDDGINEDTDLENEIHQTDMEIEFERQVLEDINVQNFIDNLDLSLSQGVNVGPSASEPYAPSFEYASPLAPDDLEHDTAANIDHGLDTINITLSEE